MNEEEKAAWQQVLDETVKGQLHHYYREVQKMKGDSMMYDPTGDVAFVVVAFNHPNDASLLPADASASDKLAAIGSASSAIMPDVHAGENGIIGPKETIPHGVQAVAAAMLLSSMQSAMTDLMGMAQATVLRQRSLN